MRGTGGGRKGVCKGGVCCCGSLCSVEFWGGVVGGVVCIGWVGRPVKGGGGGGGG